MVRYEIDFETWTDAEVGKLFGNAAMELYKRGLGYPTGRTLAAPGMTTRTAMGAIGDGIDFAFTEETE